MVNSASKFVDMNNIDKMIFKNSHLNLNIDLSQCIVHCPLVQQKHNFFNNIQVLISTKDHSSPIDES